MLNRGLPTNFGAGRPIPPRAAEHRPRCLRVWHLPFASAGTPLAARAQMTQGPQPPERWYSASPAFAATAGSNNCSALVMPICASQPLWTDQ